MKSKQVNISYQKFFILNSDVTALKMINMIVRVRDL